MITELELAIPTRSKAELYDSTCSDLLNNFGYLRHILCIRAVAELVHCIALEVASPRREGAAVNGGTGGMSLGSWVDGGVCFFTAVQSRLHEVASHGITHNRIKVTGVNVK